MDWDQYIKPELLLLVPVLYLLGAMLKKSRVSDELIPFLLGLTGILMTGLWVAATTSVTGWQDILMAVFVSLTQGLLVAGSSVYVNQLVKQGSEMGGQK